MLRKLFIAKRKKLVIGIILIVLSLSLFVGTKPSIDKFLRPFGRTPFVLVLRDFAVATYAHIKAGSDIPFDVTFDWTEVDLDHIDYSRSRILDPLLSWNISTNSLWMTEQTRLIVPFFEYEGIIEHPVEPVAIYIVPNIEDESFHILGRAFTTQGIVVINERFLLEGERQDLRQLLSTVVHELVHIQGGGFMRNWVHGTLLPSNLESRTQAATIETLAAMCYYRNELACKTFWSEIESYARGSLLMRLRMYGYEAWYDKIANLFWRDSTETLARNKSLRHWMGDESLRDYYYEIINNYQKAPWEDLIIEGLCGTGLDTGFQRETLASRNSQTRKIALYEPVIMDFDDTASLFGEGWVNLVCSLPHGPKVP